MPKRTATLRDGAATTGADTLAKTAPQLEGLAHMARQDSGLP